ncbi:MAG: right-handed parallel beta-helix repeat-containing protein [Candidatus Heimdallarchaeaceae archaeon]
MKLKKLKLLSLVFIFILSYVYAYNANKPILLLNADIENQNKLNEGIGLAKKTPKHVFKIVEEDNITIKNDEEWALYAFKGNGTKEDPYIIENKRIAIFDVEFTNKAFIIKNCTFSKGFQFLLWSAKLMSKIENSTFEYAEKMQFRNIYNMLIENCLFVSIEGDTWSIELIGSNTIAINNSLFFDVSLEILETKWLQLTDNNIRNENNSLEITDSHDIAIKNNTIFAENMVVYVAYSYNVDIANNTFSGNYTGKILTYRTTNITFQRNFFTELLTVYFFVEEEILCIEENTFLDIPRCVNLSAFKLIMNDNIFINAIIALPNYYAYAEDFKNTEIAPEADNILFNIYYNVIEMNNNSYNGLPINYIQNRNGLLINTTIDGVLILSNTLATIENISFKQILPLIIIEGSDVFIQKCTFADNFISMNVFRSKVKINNCSFINSKNGIVALDDSNIDISNSTFTGLSAGIISALGLKITYTNNDFNASTFGIRTYGTNSVKISNNRFYDVLWPIEISETANINIIANKIENTNIAIQYIKREFQIFTWRTFKVENNFITKGEMALFTNFYYQECLILNNTVSHLKNGFNLSMVFRQELKSNSISFTDVGIAIQKPTDVNIENNIIDNCNVAISADRGKGFSGYFYIQTNTIASSLIGMQITNANEIFVKQNMIKQCQISMQIINITHLSLDYCTIEDNQLGVTIENCSYFTVYENKISANYVGLMINSSKDGEIMLNTFQINDHYAIVIGKNCNNIIIHHNAFIDNNFAGTSQCYDDSGHCRWYDEETKTGNYWNDHKSYKPYTIDGEANAEDKYPLDYPPQHTTDTVTRRASETPMLFFIIILAIFRFAKNKKEKMHSRKFKNY